MHGEICYPVPNVIGYLDDLILLPLAIWLALKLIPPAVRHESRARADAVIHQGKPVNTIAAVVIGGMWLGLAATSMVLIRHLVR